MGSHSSEEPVTGRYGGDDAGEIGGQAAGDRVAGLADADAAEVHGQNVEGGLGAALQCGRNAGGE